MNIQVLTNYSRKRGIRDELLLIPKTGCLSEEDTINLSEDHVIKRNHGKRHYQESIEAAGAMSAIFVT